MPDRQVALPLGDGESLAAQGCLLPTVWVCFDVECSPACPQAVQAADSLRQQVQGAERDRSLLAATKARLAAAEKQARAAAWELEVTQQRLERVRAAGCFVLLGLRAGWAVS